MKASQILLCTVVLFAILSSVACWGTDGHQIVAQIGQSYLTSTAYTNMKTYLNGNSLPQMSTWPDDYDHTSQGSWSEGMHFINSPTNATKFMWQYCELQYTTVGCVATAIQNYTGHLYDEIKSNNPFKCVDQASNGVEPCPLSFVTHFVGDIHQPLHVSYDIDRGGNDVDVEFYTSCTNLHSLWDSGLIGHYESETGDSWETVAKKLVSFIDENPVLAGNWSMITDPADWATESFERARLEVYNFQPGTISPNSHLVKTRSSSCGYQLGDAYYDRTIPYVFDQLMKAGVRLATRLNTIYDPSFTPPLNIVPYQY